MNNDDKKTTLPIQNDPFQDENNPENIQGSNLENLEDNIEECARWFYQENPDQNNIIWKEYDNDSSELIECKYQDFLFSKDDPDFQRYEIIIESITYIIDFLDNVQFAVSTKSSKQRSIGRFQGDPNLNKNLKNTLNLAQRYRWYFSAEGIHTEEDEFLAPYRISDSDAIDKAFVEFSLLKGSNVFKTNNFEINFETWEEVSLVSKEDIKKRVYRLKECPQKITRVDYYNNEMKPVKSSKIVLDKDSISSVKSDFFLTFRNIFPSRCYSQTQYYTFYYNSVEKSLILHLKTGWTHEDDKVIPEKISTDELLIEIRNSGYKVLCKLKRENESIHFEEINPLPYFTLSKIFKRNWYYRYNQDNCFVWKQYTKKINNRLDYYYKNNYLLLGDEENIKISDDLIVNYKNNIQLILGEEISMMRFHLKNPFPDKIVRLNVPEEIFSVVNTGNNTYERKDSLNIYYANKSGPSNINELIDEIKKELQKEADNLNMNLSEEYMSLKSNYLEFLNNFNFPSLIIKLYTEESFIYRRVNKILRDHDSQSFLDFRYYYFSLLYSLNKCKDSFYNVVYRGMKLKNHNLQSFYDTLEDNQMMLFHEFLSTTYDINIAKKYADCGVGSYLLEIKLPPGENMVSNIENYSRFQHEREVLLPSGTILQYKGRRTEGELTILSMNYMISNMSAFTDLLFKLGTEVDLSRINFNLIELQNFFKHINDLPALIKVTMKVNDPILLPYFAEYISNNLKLYVTVLVRDGEINSHRVIKHSVLSEFITHLHNFDLEETNLFLNYFYLHSNKLKSLSLLNFEKNSITKYSLEDFGFNLEKLIIKNSSIINEVKFSNISYGSVTSFLCKSLVELNVIGFIFCDDAYAHICEFLKNSRSITIVNLMFDTCDEIKQFSKVFEKNQSLKDVNISFNNSFSNKRKIRISEGNSLTRSIYFNSIKNLNFICFVNGLLQYQPQIKYLNLSENQLNRKRLQNSFLYYLNHFSSLQILDLSSNLICDYLIQDVYEQLKLNSNLKILYLENNLVSSQMISLLSEISGIEIKLDNNLTNDNKIPKRLKKPDRYNLSHTLTAHENVVNSIVELSNGNIASFSVDGVIKIWDQHIDYSCLYTLRDHNDSVNRLIELYNGNIASCSDDQTIKIWNTHNNYECIYTLYGHNCTVDCIIELSDRNIASCSNDETIKIWDASNNYNCIYNLIDHKNSVNSLIELSNTYIASCSSDGTIKIWEGSQQYQLKQTLNDHEYSVENLFKLSNGNIASYSLDKTIIIWDTNDNYKSIHKLIGHTECINSLIELLEEKIASCSNDRTIKIWDGKNNFVCIFTLINHNDHVNSLIKLSNGYIASCSKDRTIKIWDEKNNFNCIQTFIGHKGSLKSITELFNGNIASTSDDKTIKIWEGNDKYTCINSFTSYTNCINLFNRLSNGNIILSSSEGLIRIMDRNNDYNCIYTLAGHKYSVGSILELSNRIIVSGSSDGIINIWDSNNNYIWTYTIPGHTSSVNSLIELSNGNFASSSGDRTIKIWNGNNNYECMYTLYGHKYSVNSIIELVSGNIASCSSDKTIKIWDRKNNYSCLFNLTENKEYLNKLLKLSNGNFVSISEKGTIKIWDGFITYSCIYTITNKENPSKHLIELTYGNIAICSNDRTIQILDACNNYNCIYTLNGHNQTINCLIQLSDGNIASCSDDHTIIIWDRNNNYECNHILSGHNDSIFSIIELTDGIIASCSTDINFKVWLKLT